MELFLLPNHPNLDSQKAYRDRIQTFSKILECMPHSFTQDLNSNIRNRESINSTLPVLPDPLSS